MEQAQLDEVLACVPAGKIRFHYHRDRYVLYLLERLRHGGGMRTIRDVKHSRYAHWLHKPFIRQWLAGIGRDDLPLDELVWHWPAAVERVDYVLGLGQWGDAVWDTWYQTSRPGLNLVLQLNLPRHHERVLRRLGVEDMQWLQRTHHPIASERITLAWARLDLDWRSGQAIIEEIQSDWLRDMTELFRQAQAARQAGRPRLDCWGMELDIPELLAYRSLLSQHERTWSEAMLTAALWFLQCELGLREVYYHSWTTGNAVKRLEPEYAPPRSLYRELPERFGFERVAHGPAFLEANPKVKKVKKRQPDWHWYRWAA